MSESLRNDGRIWVPQEPGDTRPPDQIPEAERDYYLERKYPSFGNLVPRDIASRDAKEVCDEGRGVGPQAASASTSTSPTPSSASAASVIEERYGNLFEMYERITGENPYEVPMRIYPALHYTMGGLWVDYNLMSNVPGLFVLGEANFSDHGANRLGASALMQGLADGYFVLPYTIGNYLAGQARRAGRRPTCRAFRASRGRGRASASTRLLVDQGQAHRRLVPPRAGQDHVGPLRHGAQRRRACKQALAADPGAARGVLAERAASRARRAS